MSLPPWMSIPGMSNSELGALCQWTPDDIGWREAVEHDCRADDSRQIWTLEEGEGGESSLKHEGDCLEERCLNFTFGGVYLSPSWTMERQWKRADSSRGGDFKGYKAWEWYSLGMMGRIGQRRPALSELEMSFGLETRMSVGGLPPVMVSGQIEPEGASYLRISKAQSSWIPLGVFPEVVVPYISGEVVLGEKSGNDDSTASLVDRLTDDEVGRFSFKLAAGPLAPFSVGFMTFRNFKLMMAYGNEFADDQSVINTNGTFGGVGVERSAGLRMEVAGLIDVRLGKSEPPFEASFTGLVDVMNGEGLLALQHNGGWRPLPSHLPDLAMPAFRGSLRFNATGRTIAIATPLVNVVTIIPGKLEIRALPELFTEEFQGPTLTASLYIPRFPSPWGKRRKEPVKNRYLNCRASTYMGRRGCGGIWTPQITQSDGYSGCLDGCSMKGVYRKAQDWTGLADLLGAKCCEVDTHDTPCRDVQATEQQTDWVAGDSETFRTITCGDGEYMSGIHVNDFISTGRDWRGAFLSSARCCPSAAPLETCAWNTLESDIRWGLGDTEIPDPNAQTTLFNSTAVGVERAYFADCYGLEVMAGVSWGYPAGSLSNIRPKSGLKRIKCCKVGVNPMIIPPSAPPPPPPPSPKGVLGMLGQVCLQLSEEGGSQCFPMSMRPADQPLVVELSGKYDRGDLHPLAILPGNIGDMVVIRADASQPIHLTVTADLGALIDLGQDGAPANRPLMSFSLEAMVLINFASFGALPMTIHCHGQGELKSNPPGLDGAFLADITDLPLAGLGRLNNLMVSFSTADSAYMEVFGETRHISKGVGLYVNTPSPLPALCPTTVFLNLTIQSLTTILGSFSCPMNQVWFDRRQHDRRAVIPSVQYVRLAGISVGAEIIERGSAEFVVGADIQIATLGPASLSGTVLDRTAMDPCSDLSDARCLRSTITARVGLEAGSGKASLSFLLSMDSVGAWLEPMGLANFGLVDVKMEFGLKLEVSLAGTFMARIKRVAWSSPATYWKRAGDWGTTGLLTKGGAWPPDLSENADILRLETIFLYEPAPHDNSALSTLLIPKFGIKFSATNFYFSDIAVLFLQIENALRKNSADYVCNEETEGAHCNEETGEFEFVPVIKEQFVMAFSITLELSLVEEFGLKAGILLSGSAVGTLAGLSASIGLELVWQPGPLTGDAAADFLSNPLTLVRDAGVSLRVDLASPGFGLEKLEFYGKVGATLFDLEAAATIYLNEEHPSLDCTFALEYSMLDSSFGASFYTAVEFPTLGTLSAEGMININPTLSACSNDGCASWGEFSASAAFDGAVQGYCMVGSVSFSSTKLTWQTELVMQVEDTGSFTFIGAVSLSGILIQATYESTDGGQGMVRFIVSGAVAVIAGDDASDGPVANAITKVLDGKVTINSMGILLDSAQFEMQLAASLTIGSRTTDIAMGLPARGIGRRTLETAPQNASLPRAPLPSEQYARSTPWVSAKALHLERRQLQEADCAGRRRQLDEHGRQLARGGFSGADMVRSMKEKLSFSYMLERIGDVDESFDYSATVPLIDAGVACRARVVVSAAGISVTMAASFDFMGVAMAGSGTLSTSGGIEECDISGTGTITVGECDACPALSGSVRLLKAAGGTATLTNSMAFSFLNVDLTGSVTFTPRATVAAFDFEGTLDASFTYGIKMSLIEAISRSTDADNLFVRMLDQAFGLFSVNSIKIKYTGGAFVNWEIGLVLNDNPKTLKFRLPRFPTTLPDFFVLIGQLGVEVLQSLAPLDATRTLPGRASDSICAPAMPCHCAPIEIQCPDGQKWRDRRQMFQLSELAASGGHHRRLSTNATFTPGSGWDDSSNSNGTRTMALGRSSHPFTPVQPGDELIYARPPSFIALNASNITLDTSSPIMGAVLRKLSTERNCRLLEASLVAQGCCDRRLCAYAPLRINASMRLQVTEEMASVEMEAKITLTAPGNGLRSIDKSLRGRVQVDYGSASNLCDLVPGLKDFVVGSMGGGSSQICMGQKCLTINFPEVKGISLISLLPCSSLPLSG